MLVHLVTDNFDTGGGIEHIFQIVQGLPRLDFRIFARPGNAAGKFSGLGNAEVCAQGYRPGLVLKAKPDVIHIHQLRPLLAFFLDPLASYDVPVIYTAHGLHIRKYEFSAGALARLKYQLRFGLEKHLFARADRVIAVSREDQDFIKTRFKSPRVEYIPNGIDPLRLEQVRPRKIEFGNEFSLPTGGFLFITVARFNFQKGYDVLLRAIALVRDFLNEKKARFLLVGDGETLDETKRMAEQLQITGLVHFPGNRTDAYALIKSADALILPSRWEGLPIVLLEAGLLKIPVIASDACGNNELLGEGRGVLFENENAGDLAEKIKGAIGGDLGLGRRADSFFNEIKKNYSVARMLASLQGIYSSTHGR